MWGAPEGNDGVPPFPLPRINPPLAGDLVDGGAKESENIRTFFNLFFSVVSSLVALAACRFNCLAVNWKRVRSCWARAQMRRLALRLKRDFSSPPDIVGRVIRVPVVFCSGRGRQR